MRVRQVKMEEGGTYRQRLENTVLTGPQGGSKKGDSDAKKVQREGKLDVEAEGF